MSRREYSASIIVNGLQVTKIVIDLHYEKKHSKSISDEIILHLVKMLDGQRFDPDDTDPPYRYFVTDKMLFQGKLYKLVWLLEEHEIYIGIVNAHRR